MKILLQIFIVSVFISGCGGGGGGGGGAPEVPFSLTLSSNTSFSVDEDNTLSGSVSASANESVTLNYSITSQPTQGTISLNNSGNFTYNSNADYFGSDTFSYSVTAVEKNVTRTANVNITVNPVNDAPTISLTQLAGSSDDNPYPVNISSGTVEIEFNINDIDNDNSSLSIEASSDQGNVTVAYDSSLSTSSATLDITQISLAGEVDINISVSDGTDTASDVLKFWYAKKQATNNNDIVYTLYGNQSDENRKINKVIVLDSLASDNIIEAARKGNKSFVEFVGENEIDYFVERYMNVLVAETPKGDASVLGVETDCEDAVDPNTYCLNDETGEFVYDYLENYFSDIDAITIITGVDGRGTAYPSLKISIQDLLDADDSTLRATVLTMKHEFGHTFVDLGDEYTSDFERGDVDCLEDDDIEENDYPCERVDSSINTTSVQTPEELRWKHHITDIDNVNGFDNTISTDGVGMYEGNYYGVDDVYRPSYDSVMNGLGDGYSDYINFGTSSKGVQFDEIAMEGFAIESLKAQGLHNMSAEFDDDGNIIATQNLTISPEDFHIDWYIDGVLDASKRNERSVMLEKKDSGFSTIGIRVSEVTQKFIKVNDDLHTFADVYNGLFSFEKTFFYCASYGREAYSDLEGYTDFVCRNTVYVVLTSGSSLWYHFDDLEDISQYSDIDYFYETSGLGEIFGIDWSNQ